MFMWMKITFHHNNSSVSYCSAPDSDGRKLIKEVYHSLMIPCHETAGERTHTHTHDIVVNEIVNFNVR